jgi:DNA-binding MarR family transcriptional regulator
MVEETETKRPGPSIDLLEKIRALRNERAHVGAEVSKLNDRMKELAIQISAYEDAASMVFGESQYSALMAAIEGNILARTALNSSLTSSVSVAKGLYAFGRDTFAASPRKKSLSEAWAKLLLSMAEHESFSYDDLVTMAEIMDYDVAKPTMRSQIKTYVDNGLVERLENERGRFRLTPSGRETAEAALNSRSPEPSPIVKTVGHLDKLVDIDDLVGDDPSSGSGGTNKSIFD